MLSPDLRNVVSTHSWVSPGKPEGAVARQVLSTTCELGTTLPNGAGDRTLWGGVSAHNMLVRRCYGRKENVSWL